MSTLLIKMEEDFVIACGKGLEKIISFVIDNVDIHYRDDLPIREAIRKGRVKIVKLLFERAYFDPNHLLSLALKSESKDRPHLLNYLLSVGACLSNVNNVSDLFNIVDGERALWSETVPSILSQYDLNIIADIDECFLIYWRDFWNNEDYNIFTPYLGKLKAQTIYNVLIKAPTENMIKYLDYIDIDMCETVFNNITRNNDVWYAKDMLKALMSIGISSQNAYLKLLEIRDADKFINLQRLIGIERETLALCLEYLEGQDVEKSPNLSRIDKFLKDLPDHPDS